MTSVGYIMTSVGYIMTSVGYIMTSRIFSGNVAYFDSDNPSLKDNENYYDNHTADEDNNNTCRVYGHLTRSVSINTVTFM